MIPMLGTALLSAAHMARSTASAMSPKDVNVNNAASQLQQH